MTRQIRRNLHTEKLSRALDRCSTQISNWLIRRRKYWKDLLTPTMATANVDFPVPFAPVMIIPFGCLAVTIFSISSSLKQVQQSHALIKLKTLWKQQFQLKIIKSFARQLSQRKSNKCNVTKYIATVVIYSSCVGPQPEENWKHGMTPSCHQVCSHIMRCKK